ncbi:MAG: hypothetical protein ACAH80_02090 [Alphaproteobacteria bacterium]
MEPEDILHAGRRRGAGFYCLLLLMLAVTWGLFTQAMPYMWTQDGGVVTGRVEGPAVTGWNPKLDKAIAPLMPLLSCHEISYQAPDKSSQRFSGCLFDAKKHPAGEQLDLRYSVGEVSFADPMIGIRAGIAASLWLTFSLLVFFRLPRRS